MISLFFAIWGILVMAFFGAYPWFRQPSRRVKTEIVSDLSMVTAA